MHVSLAAIVYADYGSAGSVVGYVSEYCYTAVPVYGYIAAILRNKVFAHYEVSILRWCYVGTDVEVGAVDYGYIAIYYYSTPWVDDEVCIQGHITGYIECSIDVDGRAVIDSKVAIDCKRCSRRDVYGRTQRVEAWRRHVMINRDGSITAGGNGCVIPPPGSIVPGCGDCPRTVCPTGVVLTVGERSDYHECQQQYERVYRKGVFVFTDQ